MKRLQAISSFSLPTSSFPTRPRGAVRSARHPVTVEVAGSNPAGDALWKDEGGRMNECQRRFILHPSDFILSGGTVRQLVERPSSNLGACGFESLPCY